MAEDRCRWVRCINKDCNNYMTTVGLHMQEHQGYYMFLNIICQCGAEPKIVDMRAE